MAAIRSRDTRAERLLRAALRQAGYLGYRCNLAALPGKPDIVFTRKRIAIFVDGAYWHGHPDHFTLGHLGDYWDRKILRTQQRDREQSGQLKALGFVVIRFWDFEVLADPQRCAQAIAGCYEGVELKVPVEPPHGYSKAAEERASYGVPKRGDHSAPTPGHRRQAKRHRAKPGPTGR